MGKKTQLQVHKRFFLLSAFLAIIFLFWIFTKDNFLFVLLLSCVLFTIASYIYVVNSLRDIEVKRFSFGAIRSVGEIYEERFEIINRSKFPIFNLSLIDKSKILTAINSRVISNLMPGEQISFITQAYLFSRGFFNLEQLDLKTSDPFGFFEKTISKFFKNTLVVYPNAYDLRTIPMKASLSVSGIQRQLRTSSNSPLAVSIREYLPGDPLNRVHWPISVKKDKLMVKEFEEDTQNNAWIFLDAKGNNYITKKNPLIMAFNRHMLPLGIKKTYTLPRDSFEYAVSISSSLTQYFLNRNIAVGFTSSAEKLTNIPAERGKRQQGKILRYLAEIQNNGKVKLEEVLERQLKNLSRGTFLLLITPKISHRLEMLLNIILQKGYQYHIYQPINQSFQVPEKTIDLEIRSDVTRILYQE